MIDIILFASSKKNLSKTLMSILLQEISHPIHVTIISQSSREKFDEIIQKFQEFFPIDSYPFRKKDFLNFILSHTHGDSILFLNSGDLFYHTDSLEKLYSTLSSKNYDFVSGLDFYIQDFSQEIYHGKLYQRDFLTHSGSFKSENTFQLDEIIYYFPYKED